MGAASHTPSGADFTSYAYIYGVGETPFDEVVIQVDGVPHPEFAHYRLQPIGDADGELIVDLVLNDCPRSIRIIDWFSGERVGLITDLHLLGSYADSRYRYSFRLCRES